MIISIALKPSHVWLSGQIEQYVPPISLPALHMDVFHWLGSFFDQLAMLGPRASPKSHHVILLPKANKHQAAKMENAHTGYTLPSPGKYWMQALSPSASLRGNKRARCQHPALPWTRGHRITVSAALTKQGWNFFEADLNPSFWERVSSIFPCLCSHLSVCLWTGCVQYVGERNSMFSQTEAWIDHAHTYQNKLTTYPHLSEGRGLNSPYHKAQACFFFSLHNAEENCTITLACTIQQI